MRTESVKTTLHASLNENKDTVEKSHVHLYTRRGHHRHAKADRPTMET